MMMNKTRMEKWCCFLWIGSWHYLPWWTHKRIWGLIGWQGVCASIVYLRGKPSLALKVVSRGLPLIVKQTVCQKEGGLLTDNHSHSTYCDKKQQQTKAKHYAGWIAVQLRGNVQLLQCDTRTTACINKMFCKISGAELCTSCTLLQA